MCLWGELGRAGHLLGMLLPQSPSFPAVRPKVGCMVWQCTRLSYPSSLLLVIMPCTTLQDEFRSRHGKGVLGCFTANTPRKLCIVGLGSVGSCCLSGQAELSGFDFQQVTGRTAMLV
jgi:hypothetical protein